MEMAPVLIPKTTLVSKVNQQATARDSIRRTILAEPEALLDAILRTTPAALLEVRIKIHLR
jgi:hypothetical protein